MATVRVVATMTPPQLRRAIGGFAPRYVADWDSWLLTRPADRPAELGRILRRWQAARPYAMRRPRREATHRRPFLEDLLADAAGPLRVIERTDVRRFHARTATQEQALRDLWSVFSRLTVTGSASCVGISKAVMLTTRGRIGPALDSEARRALGISHVMTADEWIAVLDAVAADIAAFEERWGPLSAAVPPRFAALHSGRLYDMVVGPRG